MFTSMFWQSLFTFQGTQLNLSTAYHPQTDGQTEVVNRCLEVYLRCITGERPKAWVQWLPLAEWWFNTTYHSSTHLTPYEALYGQSPPTYHHYIPGMSSVTAVDQWGTTRESTIQLLKEHLSKAQHRMKQLADHHRIEREFQIGDWVYLRLQPYKQATAQFRSNMKLFPRFYGPYQVIQKVGKLLISWHYQLLHGFHPVFHVLSLRGNWASKMFHRPHCLLSLKLVLWTLCPLPSLIED